MKKFFGNAFGYCIGLLVVAIRLIVSGYVVHNFWKWFVLPVFDVPHISVGQAVGIVLIVGYMCKYKRFVSTEDEKKQALKDMGLSLLHPFAMWLIGYMVYCLI
jgi:hypothetical protein